MKNLKTQIQTAVTLLAIVAFNIAASAQSSTTNQGSTSGISISAYVSDRIANFPAEAKEILMNKLSQVITQNGISNGPIGSRFILTPNISVMTKDVLPGPPPMIAYNLDITFFVGDGIDGRAFASKTISLKGVGTNETKAYIDAIKHIQANDPNVVAVLEEGKKKIMDYYNTNCENIIKGALAAGARTNYDEAIASLIGVPDACKPCYDKALAAAEPMYKKYIDQQCNIKLTQARSAWNANQNSSGANAAGQLLSSIEPTAACYSEASSLNKEISKRMEELGDKQWNYTMKQLDATVEIAKARISAYADLRAAYYYSHSTNFAYNIIRWW